MNEHSHYQVHANVNAADGDAGLRVTITFYDDSGHMVTTRTWRKHVRDLTFAGSDWQAYSAVCELAKMMAEVTGSELEHLDLDTPLF